MQCLILCNPPIHTHTPHPHQHIHTHTKSRACFQILLLEAYEQLEKDVGKEIDKALSKQAEDLRAAQRRAEFLTQVLCMSMLVQIHTPKISPVTAHSAVGCCGCKVCVCVCVQY